MEKEKPKNLGNPAELLKKGIEEQIENLENLVRMMREDEEVFGLTREDREKISKWSGEISILKQKLKNKK